MDSRADGVIALSPLPKTNVEEDLSFLTQHNDTVRRDVSSSATPGSYLVPTIQAAEIVSMLSEYGVLRRAGVRIISMVGIEKLNMPRALHYPRLNGWVKTLHRHSPTLTWAK